MEVVILKLPTTDKGLLLCWNFMMSSPELKPNKITGVEVKNKSRIECRLTEPLLNNEQKVENLFVSQQSSKPHVVCRRFCPPFYFFQIFTSKHLTTVSLSNVIKSVFE